MYLDKLEIGKCYYYNDKTNLNILNLLKILTNFGYKSLLISRFKDLNIYNEHELENIKTAFFCKKPVLNYDAIIDPMALVSRIKKFCKENYKSAIMIERIDYLIFTSSFKKFIESLYQITDVISEFKSFLFLKLDPSVLKENEEVIIRKELYPFPKQSPSILTLSDELLDILSYLCDLKKQRLTVNYKKIKKDKCLSYPTISKRLSSLEDKGLINVKRQGRKKIINVLERGYDMINEIKV